LKNGQAVDVVTIARLYVKILLDRGGGRLASSMNFVPPLRETPRRHSGSAAEEVVNNAIG